jgi:hypothetical protein
MTYQLNVIEAPHGIDGLRYDNPQAVISSDSQQDVLHRIERLQVKNGRLKVLPGLPRTSSSAS